MNTTTAAIEVRDVRTRFREHEVLRGIDLSIPQGALVGLIGPSGGGKSVLLKAIAGVLDSPDIEQSGSIQLVGRCSLMFQEGALFDSLAVFDNLAFPLLNGRVPARNLSPELREPVRIAVQDALARVGLVAAAWKYPAQLSGGMRRRVSLARALIDRPDIALLDDPTAGLDPVASSVIMELIAELQRERGFTALIVSHDLRRLLPLVDSVVALREGRVEFQGTVSELISSGLAELLNFVACRYDIGGSPPRQGIPS